MNFSEYQLAAARTAKMFESSQANLIHAALGIATEGGEFTTEVKRHAIYSKELSPAMRQHMLEELGDLMWYIALAVTHLGSDLGAVAAANIEKLKERFPEKYTDQAAEARADKSGLSARES